jgi:hypothetical protein
MTTPPSTQHEVDLPAGGRITLRDADEVDLWETALERYIEDYHLTKTNDLMQLGVLLQFQVAAYRAQRNMNPRPKLDAQGLPTGQMIVPDDRQVMSAMTELTKASEQVQKIEKLLGIDKSSREAGGQHTVANYITTLKKAAHERGIHIVERNKEVEGFINELSWRLRVLNDADAEDRGYHDIKPETICEWARGEVARIQQMDKDYAATKGKLYAGKL